MDRTKMRIEGNKPSFNEHSKTRHYKNYKTTNVTNLQLSCVDTGTNTHQNTSETLAAFV